MKRVAIKVPGVYLLEVSVPELEHLGLHILVLHTDSASFASGLMVLQLNVGMLVPGVLVGLQRLRELRAQLVDLAVVGGSQVAEDADVLLPLPPGNGLCLFGMGREVVPGVDNFLDLLALLAYGVLGVPEFLSKLRVLLVP